MEIGNKIILKPISKHGKDRVHQFGNEWILERICERVGFDHRIGPWLGLKDLNGKDFRWVRLDQDKDFKIVETQ